MRIALYVSPNCILFCFVVRQLSHIENIAVENVFKSCTNNNIFIQILKLQALLCIGNEINEQINITDTLRYIFNNAPHPVLGPLTFFVRALIPNH